MIADLNEALSPSLQLMDAVMVMEGSDEAVTTALLKVGSLGNVRTETLRGFSLEEMKKLVGKVP